MQKQTEEQFSSAANLIQKKLGEQISSLTVALKTVARGDNFENMDIPKMIPVALATQDLVGIHINNIFVFDDRDRMVVPCNLQAIEPSSQAFRNLDWGALNAEVERLDRMEFEEKDVSGAVQGYIALQTQTLSAPLQAALLKNIASGYRKLGQDHLAEVAYLKLLSDYGQVVDVSGYPMAILAQQLLIRLYETDKSWDRSLDVQLDLFEGVLLHRWSLNDVQQKPIIDDLTKSISRVLTLTGIRSTDQRHRWEELQKLQTRLSAVRPKAMDFADREWSPLLKRLENRGWLESGGVVELNSNGLGKEIAVVSPILSSGDVHHKGLVVALLSSDEFWGSVRKALLELTRPTGLQASWNQPDTPLNSVTDPGKSLWKHRLEREVELIDPPLSIQLWDASSQGGEQLFLRRRLIYGGMIGLSLLVIAVGMFVMMQAVKRETEVANLKADFVANVSHELRTPLAAISHIGERLSLGRVRSEEERNEFYTLLGKETKRLRTLIEDILDFSKMLAGQQNYGRRHLDLSKIMQEAQEHFKGKAIPEGFEISFNLPVGKIEVLGDSRALLQAILNLLDNAMKYSGESRKIMASLHTASHQAVVEIQDFGIGINEIEQNRIFEKFYRVEHTPLSGSARGVGLGLAMVRHIVEGHGGKIHVKSELGKGSTFSIEIPLAQGD